MGNHTVTCPQCLGTGDVDVGDWEEDCDWCNGDGVMGEDRARRLVLRERLIIERERAVTRR